MIITGGPSEGTYTINEVISDFEFRVREAIAGSVNIGTAEFFHPEAAAQTGFVGEGTLENFDNVSDALKYLDYAIPKINAEPSAITERQVVYINNDGAVELAIATFEDLLKFSIGMVVEETIEAGEEGSVVVKTGGVIPGFSNLATGEPIYVSRTTPGGIIQSLGTFDTGDQVYKVGRALSTSTVLFKPEAKVEL